MEDDDGDEADESSPQNVAFSAHQIEDESGKRIVITWNKPDDEE